MDPHRLLFRTEVYLIVSAALEVLKEIGHGFHEKPYENALMVELSLRGMSCEAQHRFEIIYKGVKVGEYIPDLIADGKIVIDTKVLDKISDHERGQMINYLKITGFHVGLILNFRRAKLEWERIVFEPRTDANGRE
jgi:GxxExxY protein